MSTTHNALPFKGPGRFGGYALLVLAVLCIVAPFAWILMNSFKQPIAILSGAWSFTPTLGNYADVLVSRRSDFAANVRNSIIVATASTALVLIVGTLAAYSLYRFRWAQWVTTLFLGWMLVFHMIPALTLVGPWYIAFRELGWYDTLGGLILTHVTMNLPMTVWLMMAFFREIPPEIEEAAHIDGCQSLQAFWHIALPLVAPGLIAAGILAFIFSWNEFSIALNLTSRDTATVPVAIARFAQQYEIQYSQMAAAAVISTLPALILMAIGQRFIVRGLMLGSVK
ncbi:MAG: carbohydrate ABC transporter permease [Casimicrobiaceae bacterium]